MSMKTDNVNVKNMNIKNMILRVAMANVKYYKRKNILTGIAIFLTTLLLFLVPTIGYDLIASQDAVVNKIYPTWHALYRNVTEDIATKLSAHHLVKRSGLRSDLGVMAVPDADIAMIYLDYDGFDMYHIKLSEGRFPKAENEIVVSKGILNELSQTGEVGDIITVPYQVYRDGGLDFIQEKEFVICGFVADDDTSNSKKAYTAFVSKSLIQKEIPQDQILYRFLFQILTDDRATTDEIEEKINQLAYFFNIPEQSIGINKDYLMANYIDPSYLPIITLIMLIIVVAGIITIYSIYYVSMGERVREYGQIKAIGATKKQLRLIVFMEGLITAGIAIPLGLLTGTVLTKFIYLGLLDLYKDENVMLSVMKELIANGEIKLIHWWIYLIAIIVALVTVCISLLRPMKIAAKVSEIEAMRYHDGQTIRKKKRKGYQDITVSGLTKVYLAGNKKKSIVTICSMAITGLFFMIVATVLSCAEPAELANNSILGEYEISPVVKSGDKEHPELEWSEVQKNNPLTDELKDRILKIDGVNRVECFKLTYVTSDSFDEREYIIGVPETRKEELEKGIIKGSTSYEELTTGDKVIIEDNLLYWYPDLSIGDFINVVVEDGNGTHERKLEIVAIGDYPLSLTNYSFLIMAQDGISKLSKHNLNFYYHIFAEEKYNPQVENELKSIIAESGRLEIRVWKEVYEEKKSSMAMTSGICYSFLGILGAICIINMINTMIYGVHIRKKEFGMLQAVGMSDIQLHNMLRYEGLFYTLGTLIISVGGGSLLGYPVFILAKNNGILGIRIYHYPVKAAIIVIVVLVIVQYILTLVLSKSMKKESLVERIRFNN